MIRRLYVENFRCLGQFSMEIEGLSSVLLVGRNGAGKSAIREALHRLRRLASGQVRLNDAFTIADLNWTMQSRKTAFLLEIELGRYRID